MEWNRLYGKDRKPTLEEAGTFAGGLLSEDFMGFMAENCPAAPKLEYSGCTMQPGWNIKFKKNGKNVCTLYPLDGYFICMILIGGDAMAEMEARLGDFTPYIQGKFRDTRIFQGSRWLYLEIRDQAVERDLEELVFHGPDARSDPGKRKENDTGKRKGNDTGKRKGNGRARERKTERG